MLKSREDPDNSLQCPVSQSENKKASCLLSSLRQFRLASLWLHELRSRIFQNTRLLRVWTPPGYDGKSPSRYPVLYLNDGQNLFDPATAFAGVHWGVSETRVASDRREKNSAADHRRHRQHQGPRS